MALRISSLTKEYVKVPTRSFSAGLPVNPTDNTVEMAFTAESVEPESGDWAEASWETWPGNYYLARCLVGPGGAAELVDGRYDVWIRVTTNQETVVRKVGKLVVT